MTGFTGKRHGFTEEDFGPYLRGKVELPNFVELDLAVGIGCIAAGGGLRVRQPVENAKLPKDTSTWGRWARYFLGVTQGGTLDGTGYVIWYGDNGNGRVGRFALCQHKKQGGSAAQSQRGYHPGHCTKCGLDMTVDSSD